MIITNNFLPDDVFKALQDYCNTNEFEIKQVGNKQFSVLPVPDFLLGFFQIPDHDLILAFLRSAKSDFDIRPSIHHDGVMAGMKIALASVLYINSKDDVTKNGTAFWKHHIYGKNAPDEISNEEFDRLLIEDANDLTKWKRIKTVWAEPNRRVLFSGKTFHSKFPSIIEVGNRKVLVCFYSKQEEL